MSIFQMKSKIAELQISLLLYFCIIHWRIKPIFAFHIHHFQMVLAPSIVSNCLQDFFWQVFPFGTELHVVRWRCLKLGVKVWEWETYFSMFSAYGLSERTQIKIIYLVVFNLQQIHPSSNYQVWFSYLYCFLHHLVHVLKSRSLSNFNYSFHKSKKYYKTCIIYKPHFVSIKRCLRTFFLGLELLSL